MNRRQVLGLGATLFLTACGKGYHRQLLQDLYKEKRINEVSAIQKVINSYEILVTNTKYRLTKEGEIEKAQRGGIGIVINNYIISLNHIVSMDSIVFNTPFGLVAQEIFKEKEETTLDDIVLKEVVKDKEQDIAVFKVYDEYIGDKFPFALGDSDKIQYGQEVLLIGNPQLQGINVREGIVSSKVKGNGFYVSANITHGDSGSALIDRHTFELLGLNAQRHYDNIALIRPINLFKKYLK